MVKNRCFIPLLIILLVFLGVLTGCGAESTTSPRPPTATPPQETRTPFPPSPTPIPVAAIVNQDQITLAAFQEELARYKAAVNREVNESDRQRVIKALIEELLLAQAARERGFQVDEGEITERIQTLAQDQASFQDWLSHHGYTEESFRTHLERAAAAAWMRDQIIAEVPQAGEQIHAQQILLYDRAGAENVLQSLESGSLFSELAKNYDPQTQGELGWFPPGYLTQPELDPVLFELEEGSYSEIIPTEIGFHIVKVLERDPSRTIDPAIRLTLQKNALQDWLERRRKVSTIKVTLP